MDGGDTKLTILAQTVLPHGMLTAVRLPQIAGNHELYEAMREALIDMPEAERLLAEALALPRRLAFVGGRVALREAIAHINPERRDHAVLKTARGAPHMPDGVLGSVSHKRQLAVALAAPVTSDVTTLGVDVEEIPGVAELARPDLARKILTPQEQHLLSELAIDDAVAYREAVRLRFALKEAVYKAIDPHVHRYVRFQEVEVFPDASGETEVRLTLPEFAHRPITVRAWWMRLDAHLVATAIGSPLG